MWRERERDETVNHIISKCSRLAQEEYKSRHNWLGKMFHWELCKQLKFHYTNKWYTHQPKTVLENRTHKILQAFEIKTDLSVLARWPDLILKKPEEIRVSADHLIDMHTRILNLPWFIYFSHVKLFLNTECCLSWFYGISTVVGYLMPNLFIHIYWIYDF